MPIVKHRAYDIYADGAVGTFTVNMSPAYITAQASLFLVTSDELKYVVVKKYWHRPTVDGPDQEVTFGPWYQCPSTIGADRVTSVTFEINATADSWCRAHVDLFWWS